MSAITDVQREIEWEARRDKRLFAETKPILSARAWTLNDAGSDYCAETSMSAILDAYADYRATRMAMGIYDNYGCW